MSPTASSVTGASGVSVAVGVADSDGARGKGDEVEVAINGDEGLATGDGWVGEMVEIADTLPLQADKARRAKNTHTGKYLFFIIVFNFQLHFPERFQ